MSDEDMAQLGRDLSVPLIPPGDLDVMQEAWEKELRDAGLTPPDFPLPSTGFPSPPAD